MQRLQHEVAPRFAGGNPSQAAQAGQAAIGSMEAMLGLPVEEKQKKTLQDMQDELKLMVRVWLGDDASRRRS